MASALSFLNRLLPFATPGTPIIQDVLHLAAICGALYFAPQIQEWSQHRHTPATEPTPLEQPPREEQSLPQNEAPEGVDTDHNADAQPLAEAPADHHNPNGDHIHRDGEGLNHDFDPNGDEQPDAGPARIPDLPPARNVGAKKAKALAKKDQRRAYHEFQRSQGEAQRAKDAEGATEREAEVAAERERRRAAETKVREREAREREAKREAERKAREEEVRRRALVVELVKQGLEERGRVDLMGVARHVGRDVDQEWVEGIVTASGVLGRKGDALTMITGMGWVVRVSESDMVEVYRRAIEEDAADSDGGIGHDALGTLLQQVIAA
ncbi:hypothetical protein LTR53_011649 [Teratosphaeriaceae sp. CCFEE 6253]|nr:hypothetical protein LTR53_011649 [Teratosphaeriaceae sp. CCFEE 6253]